MFTVDGTAYTLKFNTQLFKTIEMMTKSSIVGQLSTQNGNLPYQTLEIMFSLALKEEGTNEAVKQNKAVEMFGKVVKENGLVTVNQIVVEKLQEDMGFMFR